MTAPPHDARLMLGDAVRLLQAARLPEAETILAELLRAEPQNADAFALLGLAHAQRGDNVRAAELMATALAFNPAHAATHFNHANVLRKLERTDEAIDAYAKAIALRPDHMEARKARGLLLAARNRGDEALADLDRVAGAAADHAALLTQRAKLRYLAGRVPEALADYDRILALDPENWEALNNRGIVLDKLERYDEALASYERAIALNPGDDVVEHNRGATLISLQRYEEALPLFERLVANAPAVADNWSCLGVAQSSLNRVDEALMSFDRALALDTQSYRARNGRGMAFAALGRTDDAVAEYRKALAHKPDDAMTHGNLAFAMLVAGDLPGGFAEYEWRRKDGPIGRSQRTFAQSEWQGEPLKGKTLLLHPEQGFGDTIQFARFVPVLEAKGARIVLEVPAGLETLCRSLGPNVAVVRSGDQLPAFDVHAPLMSLAHKLRLTLSTIPAKVPYLYAPEDKRRRWRERLAASPRPRVGLCWSGNPVHRNDLARSIALAEFAPLVAAADASFVGLQRDVRSADAAVLAGLPRIARVMDQVADFADTAALIAELDLVITVDTSVAHVAGALGKPVWILIASAPDWRWLRERDDSPWYPTARLFRQKQRNQWQPVIAQLRDELSQFKAK